MLRYCDGTRKKKQILFRLLLLWVEIPQNSTKIFVRYIFNLFTECRVGAILPTSRGAAPWLRRKSLFFIFVKVQRRIYTKMCVCVVYMCGVYKRTTYRYREKSVAHNIVKVGLPPPVYCWDWGLPRARRFTYIYTDMCHMKYAIRFVCAVRTFILLPHSIIA